MIIGAGQSLNASSNLFQKSVIEMKYLTKYFKGKEEINNHRYSCCFGPGGIWGRGPCVWYFQRTNKGQNDSRTSESLKTKGFIIHGRSDTTLNPGGVRLGTAEIYSEVESTR